MQVHARCEHIVLLMDFNTDRICLSLLCSIIYRIGSILQATESRNVEYKAGGGNYPLKVLPSVRNLNKYSTGFPSVL